MKITLTKDDLKKEAIGKDSYSMFNDFKLLTTDMINKAREIEFFDGNKKITFKK